MTRLGVIGGGVMGEAIVRGLLSAGWTPGDVTLTDVRPERLEELRSQLGVQTSDDNRAAASSGEAILLAVKPQDVSDVLGSIRGVVRGGVLSIVAGLTTSTIARGLGGEVPVVRAMPNMPARIGRGVTALAAGEHVDEATRHLAAEVFSAVGPVVWLGEDLLDAVTAVSGSGPAYVFYLAEAMLEAAGRLGLPPDIARTLVTATVQGAAAMLGADDATPEDLRSQVTSKGGTTEAAVGVLETQSVRAVIVEAIAEAARRSKELGG